MISAIRKSIYWRDPLQFILNSLSPTALGWKAPFSLPGCPLGEHRLVWSLNVEQLALPCPWSAGLTTFARALSGSLYIFNSFLDGLWRTARWQFYFIFVTAWCSFFLPGFFSRAWFYKSMWQCSRWVLLFQPLYIDAVRASHGHVKISGLQKSNQGVFYKL